MVNYLTINLLKSIKEKEKLLFSVNTKYVQSRELRPRENSDVFNTLDEIYLVFTSKCKYPQYS